MKAKELAAILLEHPDYEVCVMDVGDSQPFPFRWRHEPHMCVESLIHNEKGVLCAIRPTAKNKANCFKIDTHIDNSMRVMMMGENDIP